MIWCHTGYNNENFVIKRFHCNIFKHKLHKMFQLVSCYQPNNCQYVYVRVWF